MSDLVAEIAVPVFLHKTFHYLIPDGMREMIFPGSRVVVPLGSRQVTGTVTGFPGKTDIAKLKPIISITDDPLPTGLLALAQWMADYYMYPLGQAIESMVPGAITRARQKKIKYLHFLASTPAVKGARQKELLLLLSERTIIPLDQLGDYSPATIKALCGAGLAEIVEKSMPDEVDCRSFTPTAPPKLMAQQQEAVEIIRDGITASRFEVFLLHGVTGSGKTEVYLHAIKHLAETGKGAIVLVPEIALTPQLLGRFRLRFGNRVAVLHSGLTDRERADEYRRIRSGRVDVAIGARSAVFAPFDKVGLIIVDEEHENSYKQDEGLRYNARDVAVMRAKFQDFIVLLGSATPSLESFYNAKTGKYRYLSLSARVDDRPMPHVAIVDMRTISKKEDTVYSPQLLAHIADRLQKKEQTLLLLNRRGFSSVLICRDCGIAVKCPSCSVSLTFHKHDGELKCHYCGFFSRPPDRCSSCNSLEIKLLGSGTQKVEEQLLTCFPQARILRMDSDTVKGRDAYEKLLRQVDQREVDILIGTQMIAKGHDFPAVTLVGIVDADVGLNLPDFRSAEKTFQLITQAAGRAGRGNTPGEVIIQTINPAHYSIIHSRTHDYEGFYKEEISYRTQLGYPPLGRFIKLEVKSASEAKASQAAELAKNRIRNRMNGKDVVLLGPAPAPISRVRGQYRFQLLLLSKKRDVLRMLAAEAGSAVEEKMGRTCRVIVDMDPINLM